MEAGQVVESIPGIGAKKAEALKACGIFTTSDLLEFFPRDYDDRQNIKPINELTPGAVNTIRGKIASQPVHTTVSRKSDGRKLDIVKAAIKDKTGFLEIVWFNQPYLTKSIKPGDEYVFTGKVQELLGAASRDSAARLQMSQPDYELAKEVNLSGGRIVPIYTTPKQFTQKSFRAIVYWLLHAVSWAGGIENVSAFAEFMPRSVMEKFGLCCRKTAIKNIHFPESDELFLAARRRLVFEELFLTQLALKNIRSGSRTQAGKTFAITDISPLTRLFPFPLTSAQKTVIGEIIGDLQSGHKMNRLVQGDVGSGKTAVAMVAAYIAAENGTQAAFMAPTEVLASQVYAGFCETFSKLGKNVVLLTGSLGAKERRDALRKIEDGSADIAVGTHALIQKGVSFGNLGLVITDEQHRFGVNQRLQLGQKGSEPHTLVMSATPIPRTLGLILYGDLDISTIDELPSGRIPIKTYSVRSSYRQRIYGFIEKETSSGRQAYVICPAIDEPENPEYKSEIKNVKNYASRLASALPNTKVALLHGQMKSAEKDEIMAQFKSGCTQVLVSTTVIEVGVNVPNASLMVIENAERFGLSQLHQLRGRVGRGCHESYCVLVTDSNQQQTRERMKAITGTTDGFALSELDLKLRGAGDFFGTRQHGLPSFRIANLYRDMDVLKEVNQATAEESFTSEPALMEEVYAVIEKAHGGVM